MPGIRPSASHRAGGGILAHDAGWRGSPRCSRQPIELFIAKRIQGSRAVRPVIGRGHGVRQENSRVTGSMRTASRSTRRFFGFGEKHVRPDVILQYSVNNRLRPCRVAASLKWRQALYPQEFPADHPRVISVLQCQLQAAPKNGLAARDVLWALARATTM
jgi:hypothetical protein